MDIKDIKIGCIVQVFDYCKQGLEMYNKRMGRASGHSHFTNSYMAGIRINFYRRS